MQHRQLGRRDPLERHHADAAGHEVVDRAVLIREEHDDVRAVLVAERVWRHFDEAAVAEDAE